MCVLYSAQDPSAKARPAEASEGKKAIGAQEFEATSDTNMEQMSAR